jgi:hypothetical protein
MKGKLYEEISTQLSDKDWDFEELYSCVLDEAKKEFPDERADKYWWNESFLSYNYGTDLKNWFKKYFGDEE